MEKIVGIFIYVLVIALFVSFGKFLRECDEELNEMRHKH